MDKNTIRAPSVSSPSLWIRGTFWGLDQNLIYSHMNIIPVMEILTPVVLKMGIKSAKYHETTWPQRRKLN